jgi:hypothetical protein
MTTGFLPHPNYSGSSSKAEGHGFPGKSISRQIVHPSDNATEVNAKVTSFPVLAGLEKSIG